MKWTGKGGVSAYNFNKDKDLDFGGEPGILEADSYLPLAHLFVWAEALGPSYN